jgi:hypothetical protein
VPSAAGNEGFPPLSASGLMTVRGLEAVYTECGISQLTVAHFVGGHILGN